MPGHQPVGLSERIVRGSGGDLQAVRANHVRAADISRRRVSLEEHLKVLGNPRGRPDRRRVIRIELTPWCHVDVQARELAGMTEDTPATLGASLTQALQEERLRKGKQP